MNPVEYNREGVGKAALLLLSLSPTLVSKILARLTRHEIQNLSDVIQRIDRRDPMIRQRQEELLDEFYFTYKAWEHLEVGRRAYAMDLLRKQSRRSHFETELPDWSPETEGVHTPRPDRQLDISRETAAAMEQLSEKERTALLLRHYEGHSINEIAEILDMTANACKQTIFRAVRKMRIALSPLVTA